MTPYEKIENTEIVESEPVMLSLALFNFPTSHVRPSPPPPRGWSGVEGLVVEVQELVVAGRVPFPSRSTGIISSWLHLLLFTILSRIRLLAYSIEDVLYDLRIEFSKCYQSFP